MSIRKSEEVFGLLPKKTPPDPWRAGAAPARPSSRELDTADRRLEELEAAFGESEAAETWSTRGGRGRSCL